MKLTYAASKDKETRATLRRLAQTLRGHAATLQRWATALEPAWKANAGHGHQLGVLMGAMRYTAMDFDRVGTMMDEPPTCPWCGVNLSKACKDVFRKSDASGFECESCAKPITGTVIRTIVLERDIENKA